MKTAIATLILFFSFYSSAQLMRGDLVDEGRKLITETDFKMVGSKGGQIVYELAVDRKGNVTSERIIEKETSIVSTPLRYKVRNQLKTFKFEEGTYYPEFHHVTIKITIIPFE